MPSAQLSAIFFLELGVIVLTCRLVGWLVRRFFGQPQVVGEMIAGALLGPSLLGMLAPDLQAALFPPTARGLLYVAAQLGVGLYMFLVGLSFDRAHFQGQAKSASLTSLSGIAAPFLAAILITPWLMGKPGLFAPSLTTLQATLFLGACIAITAFPMLARIIHEQGLSGTRLGTLALAAGAIDDAGAWIILSIVLASFGDGPWGAALAIGGAALFAALTLGPGPRLLAPLGHGIQKRGRLSETELAIALALFLMAAFAMDRIGLHAVFGGFLLGTAMPKGAFGKALREKLEPMTIVLLLPCFFVFSGLNTDLRLAIDSHVLLIGLTILAASILAKGAACYAAARLTGQDHPTALALGALMNARGLMELIIINIGLQRGLIGPVLFSILVMMAIITTLMTSPLFELVRGRRALSVAPGSERT